MKKRLKVDGQILPGYSAGMDLIKTGLGLTKTIKNMARVREILSVLARNGFAALVIKTGLHDRVPDFVLPRSDADDFLQEDEDDFATLIGLRLRRSFESLGPSFVKLGQLLSTREDMFPPGFIVEMKKLQDQVRGIEFQDAITVLEESLEKKWDTVFSKINPEPIGTASIGVVYRGQLKSGEDVVVKVRRPGIIKTIESDFSILHFILSQFEKASREIRFLSLSKIIHDFSVSIRTELDYRIEARNSDRLRSVINRVDVERIFYLPKVYRDVSTDEVLVMEHIDGIPFTDPHRVNARREQIQKSLERGIQVFIHNMLVDGFFHADLHGGNFFLMPDGRIGIVDFGLVGSLGRKSRNNLVAILYSLVTYNHEQLVYEFLDVAEYESVPDTDTLIRDVHDCLVPFIGLTVQETNFSLVFRQIMSTLAKNRVYLPREWFLVFRALMTLDGVGKSLEMDFDIFHLMESEIKSIITETYSKEQITEDALWMGRDFLASLRGFPRHMRWFLKEFAKRGYAFEVKQTGYESELRSLSRAIRFLGFVAMAVVLVFAGTKILEAASVSSWREVPGLVWALWFFAAGVFGGALLWSRKG